MAENKSLRNEIDITIPYVDDKGNKFTKKVHITFISQGIFKDFSDIDKDIRESLTLGADIERFISDYSYKMAEKSIKDTNVKVDDKQILEELNKIKQMYEDSVARLNEISTHIDTKKFNLIKKILAKNGIIDKELNDPEWWVECVAQGEDMRFISEACNKDNDLMDSKKKAINLTTTE